MLLPSTSDTWAIPAGPAATQLWSAADSVSRLAPSSAASAQLTQMSPDASS